MMAEKKPVTPEVAALLGRLFGDDSGIWVRMQAAYAARGHGTKY
jgi:plasmid maintenance system antidote protein VapI